MHHNISGYFSYNLCVPYGDYRIVQQYRGSRMEESVVRASKWSLARASKSSQSIEQNIISSRCLFHPPITNTLTQLQNSALARTNLVRLLSQQAQLLSDHSHNVPPRSQNKLHLTSSTHTTISCTLKKLQLFKHTHTHTFYSHACNLRQNGFHQRSIRKSPHPHQI